MKKHENKKVQVEHKKRKATVEGTLTNTSKEYFTVDTTDGKSLQFYWQDSNLVYLKFVDDISEEIELQKDVFMDFYCKSSYCD